MRASTSSCSAADPTDGEAVVTSATGTSGRRQFHWRRLHVPFIAPWSSENRIPSRIVRVTGRDGGQGIGYADELAVADRRQGALWVRQAVRRGCGSPDLAGVHPLRQRQAMSRMLCQVCGNSTHEGDFERWGERHLFIVRAVKGRPISDGEVTATPPVCAPCAIESVRSCPHLRKGHCAALVKRTQPWGVSGIVYSPRTLRPVESEAGAPLLNVSYDSPMIRWTQAARDVVTLHGCTPIDLDDLAAIRVPTG